MQQRSGCSEESVEKQGDANSGVSVSVVHHCCIVLTMKANDLANLVEAKIQSLRPKLLDLSRRNPLISTKLSPRSNSHIRAVDELPDILFYKLNNGQTMRLVPLPAIDDDPRDESTATFRDALINARLTDEEYLTEIGAVERDADDYLDQTRRVERALKDRVRRTLGMPARTNAAEINLAHHARINGITPSYELPEPDTEDKDGRYNDDNIQTLLLPNDLERKLNAISSKCRTWMQETGINVLHVAFGFVEWSDGTQSETSFAPLILREAQIEKRRTLSGVEFFISATGDEPELNAVLAEKLRIEFGFELPPFNGSSIEKYLSEIAALAPRNLTWRARRQVAIGVFPSARMAMYHDLDPKRPDFPESEIVRTLLVGNDAQGSSPFADEYEVDHPDIERKVPYLIMDADSSQFSTLADVVDGKNLAVEGPPGTGKSQTIVNAIAAALSNGKKVLFVAEKLAALNVVKSRLEAVGLGEFLLPLQAERSTREQVIESIRERLGMRSGPTIKDYDIKLDEYRKARDQIAKYIDLMQRTFRETGLTVREILGKAIASDAQLAGISSEALKSCKIPNAILSGCRLKEIHEAGERIAEASKEAARAKPHWRSTKLLNPDRFTIEEICDLAASSSAALNRLADVRGKLGEVGLSVDAPSGDLPKLLVRLAEAQVLLRRYSKGLLLNLLHDDNAQAVRQFMDQCDKCRREREALSNILAIAPGVESLELVGRAADIGERHNLMTINPADLTEELDGKRKLIATLSNIRSALNSLVERQPESRTWTLADLAKANTLLKAAGNTVLLLRNARTAEPDGRYFLQRLCRDGRELQSQRDKISSEVSLTTDISIERLSECISTIRSAGFFRIFSGQYRAAKRLFRSMSRTGKYRRRDAIRTLEALIVFRRGETEFKTFSQPLATVDPYFKGLETDFDLYESLARFYHNVDTQFGHSDKKSLRDFLRDAPPNELDLIPPIPPTETQINYESLEASIAVAKTEARKLDEAITALGSCVHVFVDPSSINPRDIPALQERVRSLIDEEKVLDARADIRNIVGGHFEGSKSRLEELSAALRWARAESSLNRAVTSIIAADKVAQAQECVEEVIRAEQSAKESLIRLSETAKVDSEHFTAGRSLREAAAALNEAAEDADGLFAHAFFATVVDEARPLGLLPLVEERSKGNGVLDGLATQFEAVAARQMARSVHSELGGELVKYNGKRLDELRRKLAELDREIIRLSRKQLRAKV